MDKLAPHHLATLHKGSGISLEVIEARGYRTVDFGDGKTLLDLGFTLGQFSLPAILVPLWNVLGQQEGYAIRMDNPGDRGKYQRIRGSRNAIDANPLTTKEQLRDGSQPLFITEGAKKADAIVSQGGIAVNIAGVYNWRGANEFGWKTTLPDWDEIALNGRNVLLCFDSDVQTNINVRKALDRLSAVLKMRGAEVWVVLFPYADTGKIGVDDYLLTHTLSDVEELAVSQASLASDDPLVEYPMTDQGAAERFLEVNKGRAFYCSSTGVWYCWDGVRWDGTNPVKIESLAKETTRIVQARVFALDDSAPRKDDLIKYAIGLEQSSKLESMVKLARSEMDVALDKLDSDPWLLNCENGVVDLRTGELRGHNPEDLITRRVPVRYDPEARSDIWERFIHESMMGDEEMVRFLKVATGYSATGLTTEEKLFMVIGPPRTGKSTFIKAVRDVLGDYSRTADFRTFIRGRSEGANAATEALARLAGARFVSSVEVDEGQELAAALVKQVTGNDTVTARFMYKGIFEFVPIMKLWLVSNHEPIVEKDETGVWSRIVLLAFRNQVPASSQDHSLKHKLAQPAELSAILTWIIQGATEWYQAGLRMALPQKVQVEVAAYRERMDPIADYLAERTVVHEGARVRCMELYPDYVSWCKINGIPPQQQIGRYKFGHALEAMGVKKYKDAGDAMWYYRGIGLLTTQTGAGIRGVGE